MGSEGELESRGCRVVVVARGTQPDATSWLDNYKYPFQLLLDLPMKLYRELGLSRSVEKVWNIGSMVGYAEQKIAGTPGYPPYQGDDLHLMGGDFIVDSLGKLVLTHPSATPKDRPTLEQILTALDSPVHVTDC